MKKRNVFIFLVSALLAFGLTSCGSDNEGGPQVVTSPANPINNFNNLNSYQQDTITNLRSQIDSDRFVKTNYFVTTEMEEFERVSEVREVRCLFWDCDVQVTEFVSLGTQTRTESYNTINHPNGNTRAAVENYFLSLVNRTIDVRLSGSTYYLLLDNGDMVNFNLNYPMSANPVWQYSPSSNRGVSFSRYY